LRNTITYELDYADLLSIVDFEGTKCKADEVVGNGYMDYVRHDCEGTWLDVDK